MKVEEIKKVFASAEPEAQVFIPNFDGIGGICFTNQFEVKLLLDTVDLVPKVNDELTDMDKKIFISRSVHVEEKRMRVMYGINDTAIVGGNLIATYARKFYSSCIAGEPDMEDLLKIIALSEIIMIDKAKWGGVPAFAGITSPTAGAVPPLKGDYQQSDKSAATDESPSTMPEFKQGRGQINEFGGRDDN